MKPKIYLPLKTDEVHIWSAYLLDDEIEVNYFTTLLSEGECERAKKFIFSRDKRRFIIARGILRILLSRYLGYFPQNIKIIYGHWGKPALSKNNLLHFNVSHSKDWALYALTLNYEVGIDLEYIDKKLELEDMVLTIFSPLELNYWKNLKAEDKMQVFFNFWVCKEALLKASGKGWAESEEEIMFKKQYAFKERTTNCFLKNKVTYPYCFEWIPNYASALFVEGPPLRTVYYNWNQNMLQSNAGNTAYAPLQGDIEYARIKNT